LEIDIVKRFLVLSTTLAALTLLWCARATVAMAHRRRTNEELKHEIHRWEDEGGNVATPALH
jgi:hypothetical protein